MKYIVIDTPCRPRRYKVESIQFPRSNNSWVEYFVNKKEAEKECERRNKN